MKRKAYAKLNLCLDVVSKRDDGYHDLEMIMVPIDLFDTLSISKSKKTRMKTNKEYLPLDNRNTVIHALNLMRERFGFEDQFDIQLVKNTPTRGGMGGGSSNGALMLRMINDYLALNMSEEELLEMSKTLGSDVPFTMFGRPALAQGIGEKLQEIEVNLDFYIFIAKPKKGVSTPELFKSLKGKNLNRYDVKEVQKALSLGDYDMLVNSIGNSLEEPAIKIVSDIQKVKNDLLNFGFDAAIMSGAGSSVFGITRDEELVNAAVLKFYKKYDFVKKTKIIKSVRECEVID